MSHLYFILKASENLDKISVIVCVQFGFSNVIPGTNQYLRRWMNDIQCDGKKKFLSNAVLLMFIVCVRRLGNCFCQCLNRFYDYCWNKMKRPMICIS